ncbi:hypothetical protein CEXT_392541 [Caerostris extrusa]|uniref:Uncharacterized protein n=1 Tax=Caerostris extrusa TaxID=172846 RepID=A0AAV4WJ68_CAEEX|nr:hypothetical protein CEXT_392541 [Caerostris extrusa]
MAEASPKLFPLNVLLFDSNFQTIFFRHYGGRGCILTYQWINFLLADVPCETFMMLTRSLTVSFREPFSVHFIQEWNLKAVPRPSPKVWMAHSCPRLVFICCP